MPGMTIACMVDEEGGMTANILRGVSAIALGIAIVAPNMVLAQGQKATEQGGQRRDPLAIYRAAGINPQQEHKIRIITKDFDLMMMDKANHIIGLMQQMRALSLQPEPDQKLVLAKQDEINKLNGDMANERIRVIFKIRGVLTSDQRHRLAQLTQPPPAKAAPAGETELPLK